MHYNWEVAIWFAEGVKISWCLSDRVQNLKVEHFGRGAEWEESMDGWKDRCLFFWSFMYILPKCSYSGLGIQYIIDQQMASTLGESKQMRNHRVKLLILIYEEQWSFQDKYFCTGIVLNFSVYLNVLKLKKEKAYVALVFSCWITYQDDDKPVLTDFGSLCGKYKVLFKTTAK